MAVPGQYEVRLTIAGREATQPLELLIDPRVAADDVTLADMEEQFALNIRIRDAIIDAQNAVVDLEEGKTQMELGIEMGSASEQRARIALGALIEIERALVTIPDGSYQQPMLVDQLNYLYGMTSRADQKPGRDAYERLEVLEEELETRIMTLRRILEGMVLQ